jgi:hypothetical protein
MSAVTIYVERLPMHPLLGRHVLLDSRSKDYAVQPTATPVASIKHPSFIDILDQGQIGACTGNAACSCAYHQPFTAALDAPAWSYAPNEDGALAWYHDNTANDGYPGTWKPDDTGSDGLTASKMAVKARITSGYQAALDLDSSLQALMKAPGITGIPWFPSMFDAPSSGLLTVDMSQQVAGGHELCVDEVVAADDPANGTGEVLVGGPNSWNKSWGNGGRWYLKASDWWKLRQQQGDVYFWTPKTQPAPAPTPGPTPAPSDTFDADLWDATEPFRSDHHVVPHIRRAANALETWGVEKGFMS